MIKNNILRYLNSAAVFDAEDDRRAAIENERKSIKVDTVDTSNKEGDADDTENDNTENENDNTEGEKENDGEEGEGKEGETNTDNENEDETEEQKKERIAAEKLARKEARMQKRIDRLTADNNLTKQENEKLKKQLEERTVEGLTEEEVQRRAEKLAADLVKQRETKDIEKQFEKDCETLRKQAIEVNKDFDKAVKTMAEDVAIIPSVMIGMLTDLEHGNGGEVLNYLATNVEAYEDILELSQGRMMQRLVRISDQLKDAKAKKPQRTKAPEPITPITEGRDSRTSNVMPTNPTKNMDEFVRLRNQQETERRKARGY